MPSEIKEKATATMNIAVVMVPLPAQGHLNPLLHLSSHLASRRIHVHYVSSATHNRQARHRFHGWNLTAAAASHLHFHDFAFPSLPSPSPDPLLKFPSHLQPSFDAAAAHLLPHLSSLILSLSPSHHRVVLLHDSSMSFSNAAASPVSNAEAFAFHPGSATSNLCLLSQVDRFGVDFRSCFSGDFLAFLSRQQTTYSRVEGRLFNTCRSIEGASLDQLSEEPRLKGQKIFAVGPLNPVAAARRSDDECLSWLDEQPPASVLYVSFGTTSTMPREQLRELAAGLEADGHRFIWVRRDADRCDIFHGGDDDGNEDFDSTEFEKRPGSSRECQQSMSPEEITRQNLVIRKDYEKGKNRMTALWVTRIHYLSEFVTVQFGCARTTDRSSLQVKARGGVQLLCSLLSGCELSQVPCSGMCALSCACSSVAPEHLLSSPSTLGFWGERNSRASLSSSASGSPQKRAFRGFL